jgi:hypothetical protein
VAEELPQIRYPKNAPTATESMIQPLYVIKRSLNKTKINPQPKTKKPIKENLYTHMIKNE